jgi:putative oxidoreductase
MTRSVIDSIAERGAPVLLLLGRLLVAALFLPTGFGKLMNLSAFATTLASRGFPVPGIMAPLGAAIEFLAPVAIVLGVKTRHAAVALMAFTIVATASSHRFWEFADAAARQAQANNFWKNAAILGGLLFLFVRGAGRLSIDRE